MVEGSNLAPGKEDEDVVMASIQKKMFRENIRNYLDLVKPRRLA